MDIHAELLAPRTQDRQQSLAADRGEAMSARCEDLAVEVHVDVIPDRKVPSEPFVEGGVSLFYATQRLVGEDDTEPEGVVGSVPLPDLDLVLRVEELYQGREVESRGPTADDSDIEGRARGGQLPSRSRNRCSLPVAVRGSTFANSMARGYL
jgi:hypothetical protein